MNKSIVLICTHNGQSYITEQLDSILNQTLPVDEIHVHDYNSTDETVLKVNEYRKLTNSKIFLKQFPYAHGPAHSFLASLNILKLDLSGDIIIHIADQDDFWVSTKNEIVNEEFKNLNTDCVFHDVIITDDRLYQLKPTYYNGYYDVQRDLNIQSQIYTNCVIGHTLSIKLASMSKMDLNYHKDIPMHDWYLVNMMLFRNMQLTFINKALSLYRQHNSNILGANRSKGTGVFLHIRNHGFKLRSFISFQEQMGWKKIGSPYFQVIRNVKPLKKKIFILSSLYLSRL
jgi:glycosyltransferase involved in cell wall biosynthesis